jgi:hypothetical protein
MLEESIAGLTGWGLGIIRAMNPYAQESLWRA